MHYYAACASKHASRDGAAISLQTICNYMQLLRDGYKLKFGHVQK